MLDILQSDAMRRRFKHGMQVTADAAAATIGPCARPVVVGDVHAPLRVARTGLSVAMSIFFEDRAETTGAALLRQVADWAQDASGDGTASAVAVAHLLMRESVNLVGIGFDPLELRRGIEEALREADAHLNLLAQPADDVRTLECVARTAAGDPVLGNLIAQISSQGAGNLIVIEDGPCEMPHIEAVMGARIGAGYASPQLMTMGGRRRDRYRLHHPLVLLLRSPPSDAELLTPILDYARRARRPLLLVAEKPSAGMAAPLLRWSNDCGYRTLLVEIPQGQICEGGSAAAMDALAALTGAAVTDCQAGTVLEPTSLGEAGTVLSDASATLVVQSKSLKIDQPAGRSLSQVPVLRVPSRGGTDGGDTRVRAERAAQAVHSAALHGVAPGGGVALLSAASALATAGRQVPDHVTRLAFSVVQRALEEPFRQLVRNAAITPISALRRLHRRDDIEFAGVSLPSGEVVDVVEAGILDPLPVLHGVLQASACAVRLLLTTEAVAAREHDTDRHHGDLRFAVRSQSRHLAAAQIRRSSC
ncbi:TCP-1/cpn60 chaperonin family protein [Falsiroseomonas sp. E2-1-a20]|uniref:TCP-1/cpn60 chaperonin family protein n=1 Tax=Falsiroseomonas sp. E2-1-a20 TaxID=3239300 RepID=UPI003F351AC4